LNELHFFFWPQKKVGGSIKASGEESNTGVAWFCTTGKKKLAVS
jgi:hypothetical protein